MSLPPISKPNYSPLSDILCESDLELDELDLASPPITPLESMNLGDPVQEIAKKTVYVASIVRRDSSASNTPSSFAFHSRTSSMSDFSSPSPLFLQILRESTERPMSAAPSGRLVLPPLDARTVNRPQTALSRPSTASGASFLPPLNAGSRRIEVLSAPSRPKAAGNRHQFHLEPLPMQILERDSSGE